MKEIKIIIALLIVIAGLFFVDMVALISLDLPDCNCPEPEIVVQPRVFVNISDYLPLTNNELAPEQQFRYLNNGDSTLEHNITCLNDDCTDYITDADSIIIPERHGDWEDQEVIPEQECWECKPDKIFLYDISTRYYRSDDWFGSPGGQVGPDKVCNTIGSYTANYCMPEIFPVDKAGWEQTQWQYIYCWYEECEENE